MIMWKIDGMEEFLPDDENAYNDQRDLFSVDNESNEISMPKVFKDETKFCSPVSESLAKFIKMGCTQQTEVTK